MDKKINKNMKKIYILLSLLFACTVFYGQGNVYEIIDYSRYVSDNVTYPILIPDSTTSVVEYAVSGEKTLVYHDTLESCGPFNIRLLDERNLLWLSIFNSIKRDGLEIINWIGIYPEGNSNLLFINDPCETYCKYKISDDYGKVHRKGVLKNGVSVESLVGMPNGIYFLEITTCDRKSTFELQISTNNY